MMEVVIASACGSALDKTAIGIDSNGNLALFQAQSPGPANITWYLAPGFDANGVPLGASLRNKMTGDYLYTLWRPGILTPSLAVGKKTVLDPWSTWSFGGLNGIRYVSVRPVGNDNYNINLIGGCGGTSVGLWGWSGGKSNEIWTFMVDSTAKPAPTYYRIASKCSGYLAVDPVTSKIWMDGTQKRPKAPGSGLDSWDWRLDVALGKGTDGSAIPLSGFKIIHGLKNKALKADRMGQPILLQDPASLDPAAAWTAGWNGDGYMALRALRDDDENINVPGGCVSGPPLITYWWGGGQSNELWQFRQSS